MKKIDKLLRLVGIITLKFSKLEFLALNYLSVLITGYETLTNQMIFQNYTFNQKLDTIKKIISLKENGHREQVQLKTIQKIKQFNERRNLFIHGDWGDVQTAIENDFETLSVKNIKYKFESKNKNSKMWIPGENVTYTIDKLQELNNELDVLIIELEERINENRN